MKYHLILIFSALAFLGSVIANEPILWRNDGTGLFPETQAPHNWENPDNILWKTPLANSNASPIKIGGRLYCVEEPSTAVCLEAATGNVLWKREHAYVDFLGLSDEEWKAAESVRKKSEDLKRQMDKLSYSMNRLERKNNRENDWKEGRAPYFKMLRDYKTLGEEKEALHKDDTFGKVVTPAAQTGNGYTSYVPTSDGETIFFSFGIGAVVAYDLEGNQLWRRLLDHPDHMYGGSTYPVLAEDLIISRFKDFCALDKRTGEERWRISSSPTFGSPAVFEVEGNAYLFTARGRIIRAADGKEISPQMAPYNPKGQASDACSTPVIEGKDIYFVEGGPRGLWEHSYIHKLHIPDTIKKLESSGLESLWKSELPRDGYFASTLTHDGILYAAGRSKHLTALDASNGQLLYRHSVEGLLDPLFSSPTLVGDLIFLGSGDGSAIFIQPGAEYHEITRTKLRNFRSTPIFEGDVGYLRTSEHLIAFAHKP